MPPRENAEIAAPRRGMERSMMVYTDVPAHVELLPEGRFVMPECSSVFIRWEHKRIQIPPSDTPLAVRWTRNGQRFFHMEGSRYVVDDSSYMLFNCDQESSSEIDSTSPVQCYTVCFRPGLAEEVLGALLTPADRLLDEPQQHPKEALTFLSGVYPHDDVVSPALARLERQCAREEATYGWFGEQFQLLLLQLLQAHRNVCRDIEQLPAVRSATRVELYRRLHRARDYMEASLDQPVTIAEIAQIAWFSPFHFLRLFKQVFGETPHQYLTRRRLERAQTLLIQTDLPISDICCAVGFESLGSFGGLFQRHAGLSPTQFRKVRRASAVISMRNMA